LVDSESTPWLESNLRNACRKIPKFEHFSLDSRYKIGKIIGAIHFITRPGRRQKMRNHSILALAIMALWAGTAADAQYSGGTGTPDETGQALLILKSKNLNDMHATIAALEDKGIYVQHVIPPRVVIARLSTQAERFALAISNVVSVHWEAVAPFDVTEGMDLATGVAAWNHLLAPEAAAGAAAGAAAPPRIPAEATPLVGDALEPPMPAVSRLLTGPGFYVTNAPGYYSTSEFMIGKVAVGVILPESKSGIIGNYENWDPNRQQKVFDEIMEGLDWWVRQSPSSANLTFYYDQQFSIPTQYEPITKNGYINDTDQDAWVSDIFSNMGYTGTRFKQARDYINSLRTKFDTDWCYTFIVVDSNKDSDGKFADGSIAWAYRGGPYSVMNYKNDNWGISSMNLVAAHETGHIFLAADEYCQPPYGCCDFNNYGYLNVYNGNCQNGNPLSVACMMRNNENAICDYTKGQIGWRDTDGDSRPDTIDNDVNNIFDPYPTPTKNNFLTFTGTAADIPCDSPTRTDVTINKIIYVWYRVNDFPGAFANATDGSFNNDVEGYNFTIQLPMAGVYRIKTKAVSTSVNLSVERSQDVEVQFSVSPNYSFELVPGPPPPEVKVKGWDGICLDPNWDGLVCDIPGWSSDTPAFDSGVESESWIGSTDGLRTGFLMGTSWEGIKDPPVWNLLPYVIRAGDRFTLSVDARDNWSEVIPAQLQMTLYYIDPRGARVPIATQTVELTIGTGPVPPAPWQTYVLNVNSIPAEAVGRLLGIELYNPAGTPSWIGIDNVRLVWTPKCIVFIPGDINNDCYVNFLDFAALAGNWLKCNNIADPNCN
jgi:hypothetical protein